MQSKYGGERRVRPMVGHLLPPAVAGEASPLPDILSQFEMSSPRGRTFSLPPVDLSSLLWSSHVTGVHPLYMGRMNLGVLKKIN